MSLAYKVEELLALRDSVSESAVSIDRFADEDVIKEHVLRPSASANIISTASSERALRASAAPGVAPTLTNLKKPSPSPSVKRGKAERLLKEHGSPPGMRVTAGGRVVPSDLPPLSSVRCGSNNFRPPVLRSVDSGNAMSVQPQQDMNNTSNLAQVELIGTQAVIRVGERMFALPTYNPAYPVPTVLPPDIESTRPAMEVPTLIGGANGAPYAAQRSSSQSPFQAPDLAFLEAQWNQKKDELRFVEQTEVLQADHQGPTWRSQIIAKKKSLILEIDSLRKKVSAAKEADSSKRSHMPPPSIALSAPGVPSTAATASLMPQVQQPAPAMFQNVGAPLGIPAQATYPPMMVYQPFPGQLFSPEMLAIDRENQPFIHSEGDSNGNHLVKTFKQPGKVSQSSPGSANRRSHAVPIKKPHDEPQKRTIQGSVLDPKSPTYEPMVKTSAKRDGQKGGVPPTPSPAKQSPLGTNELGSSHSMYGERALSQKPSLSSIDTTDFFPTNTHEHSSTRIAPNKLTKQASYEIEAAPITPEKPWQFGPWNPPSDGLSNRANLGVPQDSLRKLTSWPEAFGKQSTMSTNKSATASSGVLRKSSTQRSGTDLNWPPIPSKPPIHSPSTYQEGYQAGLYHSGLPDNVEVLNGFVDGLMAYLKDFATKGSSQNAPWFLNGQLSHNNASSARSSLRGHLSGATLHDSAVSFSENIRSAKGNVMMSREPAFNPNHNNINTQIAYELCNEVGSEPRKSPVKYQQGKEETMRSDLTQHNVPLGRPLSGNQIAARAYGTPVSMQRYYPVAKEYGTGGTRPDIQSARPAPSNRFSGLDGAMDDLAELVADSHLEGKTPDAVHDADASCFKSSSGKGKQKSVSSPTKSVHGAGHEACSPGKASASSRKSGEHSPTKAKLEHVTKKLRRPKKDDPRTMSPDEKAENRKKWRDRFRDIKRTEREEIEKYGRENPRKDAA